MKDINKILQNANKFKIVQELLSEEEIRRIVNNIPDNRPKFVKLIRKVIIMTVPIFIVFMSLYLAAPDNPQSWQEQIYPQKPNNEIVNIFEEDEKKSESIDTRFNNLNNHIDSVNMKKNGSKKVNIEFKVVPDTAKLDAKPLEALPWKTEGITILELSDDEFEKLVPNSRYDDTTFFIYKEQLITNEKYFQKFTDKENVIISNDLANKYKAQDLPLLFLKNSIIRPSIWKFDREVSSIYQLNNYKRTLYAAYSTTDHIVGKGHAMYNNSEPLLLDYCGDYFMKEYVDFSRNYWNNLTTARNEHDSIKMNELYQRKREITNKLFQNLVPVKMEIYSGTNFIFWFYPNEEFLSAIPERYSINLRKELEIKRLVENGALDVSEACKGLNSEASIFGYCQMSDGAIKFDNLYPNPDRELTKLSFTLSVNRKINISIYDLSGKLIEELVNNKSFENGSHEIDILMDKLSLGINYLIIKTDANETIIKRILKF